MSAMAAVASGQNWRADFPSLHQSVHGRPLVYLDSAASAQQPAAVIDAVAKYHREDHSNVHRGVHELSGRATEAYEGARDKVEDFINAHSRSEVVFTSGTTESINLVAQSFCRPRLQPGDRIVITHLEHHANIVPWQMICGEAGARLRVAPINGRGELELDAYEALLGPRTRIVANVRAGSAGSFPTWMTLVATWPSTRMATTPWFWNTQSDSSFITELIQHGLQLVTYDIHQRLKMNSIMICQSFIVLVNDS